MSSLLEYLIASAENICDLHLIIETDILIGPIIRSKAVDKKKKGY